MLFFACHVFTKNEETNLDVAIALFSRLKNNTLKRTDSAFLTISLSQYNPKSYYSGVLS